MIQDAQQTIEWNGVTFIPFNTPLQLVDPLLSTFNII
jgi:hypothetical protein